MSWRWQKKPKRRFSNSLSTNSFDWTFSFRSLYFSRMDKFSRQVNKLRTAQVFSAATVHILLQLIVPSFWETQHKMTSCDESCCTTVAQKHRGSNQPKTLFFRSHRIFSMMHDDKVAEQRISKNCFGEALNTPDIQPFRVLTSSYPAACQASFFQLRRSI